MIFSLCDFVYNENQTVKLILEIYFFLTLVLHF